MPDTRRNLRITGGVRYAERTGGAAKPLTTPAGGGMDCYTPYPVEEAAEAIGFHRNYVPLICLVGGLHGVAAMFLMETWISVLAYPLNIAGRPLFSWPAFIVPAYEWTILWAGLSAALACWPCGLAAALSSAVQRAQFPQRRHFGQVLSLPGGRPIRNSIWLESRGFLEGFGPVSVVEVEY